MSNAQRFTTEYIDHEDRIRLTYQTQDGSNHAAWLTQRFLDRVVPHAVKWLEKSTQPLPRGEALQSFAQDVAVSKLPVQPAVQAEETVQPWVAYSVNLKFEESVVHLALKSRDEQFLTELHMNSEQLRQWLNIIQKQYVRAGWAMTSWPEWLVEREKISPTQPNMLH